MVRRVENITATAAPDFEAALVEDDARVAAGARDAMAWLASWLGCPASVYMAGVVV